jgi:hypothetical protein
MGSSSNSGDEDFNANKIQHNDYLDTMESGASELKQLKFHPSVINTE